MTKTWTKREDYEPDITIVTALFDGRQTSVPHTVGVYTPSWVDKLYRGFARNYSGKFDFICLTDKNYKFEEPIRNERFSMSVDEFGWLCMVDVYRPDLCKGQRFTAGLDTIITGSVDDILNLKTKISLCTDPFQPHLVCNAVTSASLEFCEEYWKLWEWKKTAWLTECQITLGGVKAPSEMEVLRTYYNDVNKLDVNFPYRILSYKKDIMRERDMLGTSSIVYFHGRPKPHQIAHENWVQRHWR